MPNYPREGPFKPRPNVHPVGQMEGPRERNVVPGGKRKVDLNLPILPEQIIAEQAMEIARLKRKVIDLEGELWSLKHP